MLLLFHELKRPVCCCARFQISICYTDWQLARAVPRSICLSAQSLNRPISLAKKVSSTILSISLDEKYLANLMNIPLTWWCGCLGGLIVNFLQTCHTAKTLRIKVTREYLTAPQECWIFCFFSEKCDGFSVSYFVTCNFPLDISRVRSFAQKQHFIFSQAAG